MLEVLEVIGEMPGIRDEVDKKTASFRPTGRNLGMQLLEGIYNRISGGWLRRSSIDLAHSQGWSDGWEHRECTPDELMAQMPWALLLPPQYQERVVGAYYRSVVVAEFILKNGLTSEN